MERQVLSRFSGACFLCPARTFADGHYYCDTMLLDDKSGSLRVSRYRPSQCPSTGSSEGNNGVAPEAILRKMLKK